MLPEDSHSRNWLHPKKSAWHFRITVKFRYQVKLSQKRKRNNNNNNNSNNNDKNSNKNNDNSNSSNSKNKSNNSFGNFVAEMVGYKNKDMREDRHPNWQRRILKKQKVLRKEWGILSWMRRGELQNEGVISNLERKFNIKRKGADMVHEKVWQRLVVLGAKLEGYDNRTKQ